MPILNMGELSIKIHKTRVLTHGFQKMNNIGCSLSWKKRKYRLEVSIGKSLLGEKAVSRRSVTLLQL